MSAPGRLERRVPRPGAGAVLLAVEACGICGADRGDIENADPAVHRVPGHEVVGRIVALGENVTGYRDRELKTRLGALNLRVPKLRQGSCFPVRPFDRSTGSIDAFGTGHSLLEPRRTSEKALVAVIQEAWIGASRRAGSTIWCRRWG